MGRIACVVFDFDGVLVQSNGAKRAAYDEAVRGLALPPNTVAECIARHREGDRRDVIDCIVRTLKLDPVEHAAVVDRCVRAYGDRCDALLPTCAEAHHASITLSRLGTVYPLYVNSATPETALHTYIADRGWTSLFRGLLGRPRTKVENFREIARREEISPERMMFVGDRQSDCDAAEAAGCLFVGVRSDGCDFNQGIDVLESLDFVPAYIAREETRC